MNKPLVPLKKPGAGETGGKPLELREMSGLSIYLDGKDVLHFDPDIYINETRTLV